MKDIKYSSRKENYLESKIKSYHSRRKTTEVERTFSGINLKTLLKSHISQLKKSLMANTTLIVDTSWMMNLTQFWNQLKAEKQQN